MRQRCRAAPSAACRDVLVTLILLADVVSPLWLVAGQTSPLLQRYYLNGTDAAAVCNDGSSAVYYMRQGQGSVDSTRWVIRFQGGAWCTDQSSCMQRQVDTPYWMSSTMLPATLSETASTPGIPDALASPGGILSTDQTLNPTFSTWNHVYVWYCTSDSSLGDTLAGLLPGLQAWQFRGRRVVAALADDLLARQGLANATQVLVTGDSAGGVSALNNADFMLQRVKSSLPKLQRWKVYADGGWFLDLPSFSDPSTRPFRAIAQTLQAAYNATFDTSCMAQLQIGQAWACFFGDYWWKYFPLPTFIGEYLYDSANLAYDGASGAMDAMVFRTAMTTSLQGPANTTRAPVQALAPSPAVATFGATTPGSNSSSQLNGGLGSRQPPSVFAEACSLHEIEDGATFFAAQVGDVYLSRALAFWFFNSTRYSEFDSYPAQRTTQQCEAPPTGPGAATNDASPPLGVPAPGPSFLAPASALGLQPVEALPSLSPEDASPPAAFAAGDPPTSPSAAAPVTSGAAPLPLIALPAPTPAPTPAPALAPQGAAPLAGSMQGCFSVACALLVLAWR